MSPALDEVGSILSWGNTPNAYLKDLKASLQDVHTLRLRDRLDFLVMSELIGLDVEVRKPKISMARAAVTIGCATCNR